MKKLFFILIITLLPTLLSAGIWYEPLTGNIMLAPKAEDIEYGSTTVKAWIDAATVGSGANALGYYLLTSSTNAPSNGINLGNLSTGLLKITVTGGTATPSVASAGVDYLAPNGSGASLTGITYTQVGAAAVGHDHSGVYQPVVTNITSWAAITRSADFDALGPLSYAEMRTTMGVQAADNDLTTWADITAAANMGTFLATPSSANLAATVTDETGSGLLVLATSPTLVTPILGTPQSGNFSTGSFSWPTFNQNTTGTAAGLTAQYIDWNSSSGGSSIANKPSLGSLALLNSVDISSNTNLSVASGIGAITLTGDELSVSAKIEAIHDLANNAGYLKNDGSGNFFYDTPSGGGDLSSTDIDTSVELYTILTDETGSGGGAPLAVFNYNPTLTGITLAGDVTQGAAYDWDLVDNNASALSWDAAGKAGILEIVTTDGSEGVKMSGTLNVAGALTAASLTLSASATPTNTILDSDAPGTDKEIAKQVGAYIDGADGSENGTLDLYVHEGGASTSYVQLDGKNQDVEINKPLRLLSSDDPDLSAPGQMSHDTDGWLRAYDNSLQKAIRLQEEIHVTVVAPNDLADATRDAFPIWENVSGMNFVITGWSASAGTDNTTLNIEETDANGANNATVDAVEIATDGTGLYYATDTTITAGTIENGHRLWLDFDDTDTPTWVKVTIYGYYNADVN